MTQYRISYNGTVLATGYTYTDAKQVQALLGREYEGIVTIEAYREDMCAPLSLAA